MDSIPLEVLRRSCAANNLPTSGTKEDLWTRLRTRQGDKRRLKGKKPDIVTVMEPPAKEPKDVTSPSKASASFVAKEYGVLKAAGFTDEDWINEEIQRRWDLNQELVATARRTDPQTTNVPKDDTAREVLLPMLMDDTQCAIANVVLVSPVKDENGNYKYHKIEPAVATAPAISPDVPAISSPDSGSKATVGGKRKAEAEPEEEAEAENEDLNEEAAIKYGMLIVTGRLMKKQNKDSMAPMLQKFGVTAKGTRQEMSEALAEQLLMETDDEAE